MSGEVKEDVLKLRALWHVCELWRNIHKPRSAESIYQRDSVQEALPGLAEVVCNIVGYYDGPDEGNSPSPDVKYAKFGKDFEFEGYDDHENAIGMFTLPAGTRCTIESDEKNGWVDVMVLEEDWKEEWGIRDLMGVLVEEASLQPYSKEVS